MEGLGKALRDSGHPMLEPGGLSTAVRELEKAAQSFMRGSVNIEFRHGKPSRVIGCNELGHGLCRDFTTAGVKEVLEHMLKGQK